ncbi:hypothetical protein A3218_01995 [Pseudomonas chlororaphis]|uniref:hypothetical protein n=1 Tax=Pseudomonas chlororaphis TaxID=587753 RepID=UPI000789D22F|nr:hypothetical protein [Pseudomonas chlororaphis]AMS13145.1 hypothetical protein A3218_01995 [Pseudomonas chlororaphis]
MGLRDDLQRDLAEAFDTDLADAVKPVAGVRTTQGEYDPDSPTPGETITTYAGRGVFGKYRSAEIDGTLIQTADEKLTILQNELFITLLEAPTATLAVPEIGDVIGDKRAMNVSQDPAGATWTVQLRK